MGIIIVYIMKYTGFVSYVKYKKIPYHYFI